MTIPVACSLQLVGLGMSVVDQPVRLLLQLACHHVLEARRRGWSLEQGMEHADTERSEQMLEGPA